MRNFVILFGVALIMFSCGKEELEYSCNPEINAIVKSGVVEFSEIELAEFLEYDIELQRGIFRSFSADKKRDFWLEKLNSVIASNEFNISEIEHIQKIIDHITLDYFAIEIDSVQFRFREEFENEWKAFAKENLVWDNSKISYIVNSLCVTEIQYAQIVIEQEEISLNALGGDCQCSTESDYCIRIGATCGDSGCSVGGACGFLLLYDCNGDCM